MSEQRFHPSSRPAASPLRIDRGDDLHDILAVVALRTARATHEVVIGLDLGRVIRVVETRELPPRARAQLEFHERTHRPLALYADELYLLDVQTVEYRPDVPGADDPVHLHGVLRGPYPKGLVRGVRGIEGELTITRATLLDGLALGIERSFVYESGRCGASCTHAVLSLEDREPRSVVLAFPLVPMGDDGSNELVAAELIRTLLGAMRADLGDDLVRDPVPVANRRHHERALAASGWTIKGDRAVKPRGRSRLAKLFLPTKKRRLPREVQLAEYRSLIDTQLARLSGWSTAERRARRHWFEVPPKPQAEPPRETRAKKVVRSPQELQGDRARKQQAKKENRNKIKMQNERRKKQRG